MLRDIQNLSWSIFNAKRYSESFVENFSYYIFRTFHGEFFILRDIQNLSWIIIHSKRYFEPFIEYFYVRVYPCLFPYKNVRQIGHGVLKL